MNLKKFIIFALLILIVSAMFTACAPGTNLPSDGTVNVETTVNEDSATQSESKTSQEETEQDSSSVYYVTEEDDLEIMTVPADDSDNDDSVDNGEKIPATNAVVETQPDNDKENKEETRIELPFIPAN